MPDAESVAADVEAAVAVEETRAALPRDHCAEAEVEVNVGLGLLGIRCHRFAVRSSRFAVDPT